MRERKEQSGKSGRRKINISLSMEEPESLPAGWTTIPFAASVSSERTHIVKVQQASYKKTGRFPVIDQGQKLIAGYWDGEAEVYRGGLPVIIFGDHTRVFKFVDFPFVVGADGTHVLAPDSVRFDPYFLYLALSSLEIPSRGYNRHFSLLKERSIIAPPLSEQRAIAAVLRAVRRAKEAEEGRRVALDKLLQSLLHNLMTGTVRVNHLAEQLEPEATR